MSEEVLLMTVKRVTVTPEVVATLSAASGMALLPERLQKLVSHLDAVLEGAAQLQEVDVSNYEPVIYFRPSSATLRRHNLP